MSRRTDGIKMGKLQTTVRLWNILKQDLIECYVAAGFFHIYWYAGTVAIQYMRKNQSEPEYSLMIPVRETSVFNLLRVVFGHYTGILRYPYMYYFDLKSSQ